MIRLLLICLFLPMLSCASFDLEISIRNIQDYEPMPNVIVDLQFEGETQSNQEGKVYFENVSINYLNSDLQFYHPNFHFDVTSITTGEYDVNDHTIKMVVYGYRKTERSFTMSATIAKSGKKKNDSIFVSVFSNSNLSSVNLNLSRPGSYSFTRTSGTNALSTRLAYDDIESGTLITTYSKEHRTSLNSLTGYDLTQNQIYVGPMLANKKDESEENLLLTYFKALDTHDENIYGIKQNHRREMGELYDSISELKDEIYFLKTGKRPEVDIEPPLPDPYPPIHEPVMEFFDEKNTAHPKIGMPQLMMDLEKALNKYKVKHSGDILLRLNVGEGGKLNVYYVHIPPGHYNLMPEINKVLESQTWIENNHTREEGQDIGLTIKIRKKK